MEQAPRSITWEAPQHHHIEKGNDWFFALLIIVVSLVLATLLLGDGLFALLVGLAGLTLMLMASKKPPVIPYAVTVRGVRIGEELHPFPTLESYRIDEDDHRGPQLLVKSKHRFMPLIIFPIPADHVDEIESILQERLLEEDLEEPLFMKVLEMFGF